MISALKLISEAFTVGVARGEKIVWTWSRCKRSNETRYSYVWHHKKYGFPRFMWLFNMTQLYFRNMVGNDKRWIRQRNRTKLRTRERVGLKPTGVQTFTREEYEHRILSGSVKRFRTKQKHTKIRPENGQGMILKGANLHRCFIQYLQTCMHIHEEIELAFVRGEGSFFCW